MSEPYFATGYVRLLYRFLRAEGASARQLFHNTNFSEADLTLADLRMPFTAQMQLCQNALAHSAPGLGLRVGFQLQLAAHGALGTAMQTATNLEVALATFSKFIAMRASFFSLSLSESDDTAEIRIAIRKLPEDLIPFFSESILFTLTHCLTFYTAQRSAVSRIQLAYPEPNYGSGYGPAFGETIEFGCLETRIAFDRGFLPLPSPEADSESFAESVRRCREQIQQQQTNDDIARSIETFLVENPGRLWKIDEIAPLFAMSSRTLIRKLKQIDTTYQVLRDNTLKRQARIYLRSMSVEATAISLGFADTSSFRRTFKRWYGVTPSAYS